MGDIIEPVRWILLAALLAAATVSDLRSRRIPNLLTFTGCLAGLAIAAAAGGLAGLAAGGKGLFLAFIITLPLWLIGWLGAGDVKLVSAVGAFVGSSLVFETLLAIGAAGGVLALIALMARGLAARTGERMAATFGLSLASRRWVHVAPDAQESDVRLPYAVAISAGTLAAVLLFG